MDKTPPHYKTLYTKSFTAVSLIFVIIPCPGEEVDVNLRRNIFTTYADVFRSSTAHTDIDTTSRDIIASLEAGEVMYVTQTSQTVFSDYLLQTSWCMMSISDAVTTLEVSHSETGLHLTDLNWELWMRKLTL